MVQELFPCLALNGIHNNIKCGERNYSSCEWAVRKFASDLRNKLISLFVGICCFFSARLICSAVGEVDGMPDGLRTSEWFVMAWVAKRVISSAGFVTRWIPSFMRFVTGLTWERDSDIISTLEDPCSGKPRDFTLVFSLCQFQPFLT